MNRKHEYRKQIRSELLKAYPFCFWCECPLTLEEATLEHVIPVSRGGTEARNNFVIACAKCNGERGAPDVEMEEFVAIRAKWRKVAHRASSRNQWKINREAKKAKLRAPAGFHLCIPADLCGEIVCY